MNKAIAVIGAGNGGAAIAAYLASQGASVHLCDLFPQYIEGIRKNGGIELCLNGTEEFRPLAMVTADACEAIRGTALIMVVTPSFTHRMIAEKIAGALEDGQVVVLNPGRTCGALDFLNGLRENGCTADVVIAETQTLIYSCRRIGESRVEIYGVKKEVDIAAFPADRTDEVLALLHPYYPQFKPVSSCLVTSLSNIGALFHPTPVLLNIGRIETDKNGFLHYIEGISPAVARLIHRIDLERMAVAKAYGADILSAEEWLKKSYDTYGGDLYELLQHNEAYQEIKGAHSIDVRYVTEDVPMSLVPISELGHIAGVDVQNIDAVILLLSSIYDRDFRAEGRNAARLGVRGLSREEVIGFLQSGKKAE
ncbi:MAG: NAD/NADP octopine/nopaline dehydrogenase family protein [Lachnospiraceae bacterium]|nr:NAD/NADP octopine/nopaline dehydrogenase family protein [Lachnospiraceae bacterium]